jgi:hypothetical protein
VGVEELRKNDHYAEYHTQDKAMFSSSEMKQKFVSRKQQIMNAM